MALSKSCKCSREQAWHAHLGGEVGREEGIGAAEDEGVHNDGELGGSLLQERGERLVGEKRGVKGLKPGAMANQSPLFGPLSRTWPLVHSASLASGSLPRRMGF